MKHILTTFLLACLLPLAMPAQGLSENQRLVGFTTTDAIDTNGAAFGSAGTYTIGALMNPRQLGAYAGCRIVGLRVAAALDLGRSRTFLYSVNGKSLSLIHEQKQRLYDGWNSIFFNGDGYTIEGSESLFFGFDYTETTEMVTAQQGGICGVGEDVDGGFYLYQNETLYQISQAGRLCVQLIVDISSLPMADIDITSFDAGFKYKMPGEEIETFVTFANAGRSTLSSYQLGYQLDDQTPVYEDFTQELAEGQSDSWQFKVLLPDDITIGNHRLRVFASQVAGEPMPDKSHNDEITVVFGVYEQSVLRSKTYLEVYTDQSSPYVPYLNDAIKLLLQDKQLVVANVHRPNTPLAIDGAAYLHQLYAYTWPTFTSNRSYFPGEDYIAYDMNYYLPLIGAEMTAGIISGIVQQDVLSPSFATLDLSLDYDAATRQLTATATGTTLPEAEAIYGDMAVTLMVIEDGVKGKQAVYNEQTQQTSIKSNYVHNQVLRAFMTEPTGDRLDIAANAFTLRRTTTLDADWQPENVTVIALLTKYADQVTEDNVRDMDVINCNSLALATTLGIADATTPDGSPSGQVYDLQGRRLKSPRPGLNIINGKVVVIK